MKLYHWSDGEFVPQSEASARKSGFRFRGLCKITRDPRWSKIFGCLVFAGLFLCRSDGLAGEVNQNTLHIPTGSPISRFYLGLSVLSGREIAQRHEIDLGKFQPVTKEFGPTVIDLSRIPYSSPMLDSGRRPWSSWWFQKVQRDFTRDATNSILAKYDRAFSLQGTPQSALRAEIARERGEYSPWEGLCDAWAVASLFYPEPQRPVVLNGVKFTVSDLKGLIVKSFEAVPDSDLPAFGEKFLGNSEAWMFPDLFPEQFHRFVEVALGDLKRPFVMDRDPGLEVWSVPVYKANFRIERTGDPASVLVKMWLFTAGPRSYDLKEAVGTDEVTFQYLYELSGDLTDGGRTLRVTTGKWLKGGYIDSRINHPDYVLLPKPSELSRASYNANFDINKIDLIVKGAL